MELLSPHMKAEMEECKRVARAAGLQFRDNTLEYGVLNNDLLELMPKHGIPTLYDYWVQDVHTIGGKWRYKVYPHNPYEMVVNTRPPISYYNHDNADWVNWFIFYHVLGHIDFYQNHESFKNTWHDDFCGVALADKRLIDKIRSDQGSERRWVDYVIEFSLAVDNLVGFHQELRETEQKEMPAMFGISSEKIDFYFGAFLKRLWEARDERATLPFYYDEVERFNRCIQQTADAAEREEIFFRDEVCQSKFPEFHNVFKKWKEKEQKPKPKDIFEYLWERSEFLKEEKNQWMKDVMAVIRRTSLYFQPQIFSRGCNEGWASLWHQRLFISDPRLKTHEIDFAKVDSGVTLDPRLGFNVYAFYMHLYEFIEDMAKKGKLSPQYALIKDIEERKRYDQHRGEAYAKEVLFSTRRYLNDYFLLNFLSDDDFQDFIDTYRYWMTGVRRSRTRWDLAEVYIKSKSSKEVRQMLNRTLYHPPYIIMSEEKAKDGELYLDHVYEGRSLHTPFIANVLIGLEYLGGRRLKLETTEYEEKRPTDWREWYRSGFARKYKKVRVLYTCDQRKVTRAVIDPPPLQPPQYAFVY